MSRLSTRGGAQRLITLLRLGELKPSAPLPDIAESQGSDSDEPSGTADEPTGSLDHASAQQLGQLLIELNREENVTLIVVTHARELAAKMAKVMRLQDGKLVAQEEELRQKN